MKSKTLALWMVAILLGFASSAQAALWNESEDKASDSAAQVVTTTKDAVNPVVKQVVKQEAKVEAKVEVKKEVKAAAVVPAAPAAPSASEEAARVQKGIDNQKAWISTLEKQLAGEKAKLAEMEGSSKTTSRSR